LACAVLQAGNPQTCDAAVIGSASYFFHWMKPARDFVRRNHFALAQRPVWLFSSGPLGMNNIDSKGRDLRKVCEPREISQAHPAEGSPGVLRHNGPAKTRILSPGFAEPSGVRSSGMLPEGDFRARDEIESWASGIYRELQRTPNTLYETPTLMP
jgi:menaquinone-dependent protoporphyrinogen oxidase